MSVIFSLFFSAVLQDLVLVVFIPQLLFSMDSVDGLLSNLWYGLLRSKCIFLLVHSLNKAG